MKTRADPVQFASMRALTSSGGGANLRQLAPARSAETTIAQSGPAARGTVSRRSSSDTLLSWQHGRRYWLEVLPGEEAIVLRPVNPLVEHMHPLDRPWVLTLVRCGGPAIETAGRS